MTEFAFLTDKPYHNLSHNYKEIVANTIDSSHIEFEFPSGNYLIESLHLVIKYDGTDVDPGANAPIANAPTGTELSIDDFVDEIVPYYDNRVDHGILKPIPGEFLKAFAMGSNSARSISKLCWEIPLLKMASFVCPLLGREYYYDMIYGRTMHLRLVKSATYAQTLRSIFVTRHAVDLTNMPTDILSYITSATESKIQFKITYRETKFLNHIGQVCPPEAVVPYILDKFETKFINSDKAHVWITHQGNRFNYSYVLIVLETDSLTSIEKVSLSSNLRENTMSGNDNHFSLSKELAEVYGLSYQLTDCHYLLDVAQYTNTVVKPFFDNRLEQIGPTDQIFDPNTIDKSVAVYHSAEDLKNNFCRTLGSQFGSDSKTNLKLKLNLEFGGAITGTARIYFFN